MYRLLAYTILCLQQNPGTHFEKCKPVVDVTYYTNNGPNGCASGARELLKKDRLINAICIKDK